MSQPARARRTTPPADPSANGTAPHPPSPGAAAFASHAARLAAQRRDARRAADRAKAAQERAEKGKRAADRDAARRLKALEAEHRRRVARAKRAADKRAAKAAAAAEAKVWAAREAEAELTRLAAEEARAGKVAAGLAGLLADCGGDRDLLAACFHEFKGAAGKRDRPALPDGAAIRQARAAILEAAADRLEQFEASDLLSVDETDTEELDQLQLTRAEWDWVKRVVLAEMFEPRPRASAPVDEPPGSPAKVDAMAARLERGEELYHPDDPREMQRADGTVVETSLPPGGAGKKCPTCGQRRPPELKVLGWAKKSKDGGDED